MTPELQVAIWKLINAAEMAAYSWETPSAVALILRAAIDEVKKLLVVEKEDANE